MYLAPDTSELGRHAPAQAAVRDLLEHVLDGLRKAGLDVPVLT
jgi:hypothetical protein